MLYHTKKTDPENVTEVQSSSHEITTNEQDWSLRSVDLARWAQDYLLNRTDVHGQYLPLEKRKAKKNVITVHEGITLDQLNRHFMGGNVGDICGLHAISSNNNSRWLVIDIDCHDDDDDIKRTNRTGAKSLYLKAMNVGLEPLLLSSDGRGGYHLWVIFKKPLSTSLVFDLGQWLVADWQELGLTQKPECFPKQRMLSAATPFGNWIRLPGRHHTRGHWSRVWDGSSWLEGEEAVDAILKTTMVSRKVVTNVINKESNEPTCEEVEAEVNACSGFQTGDAELDRFVPYLRNVKKSLKGYTSSCPCPDHPDKHPSFSFRRSEDGRIQFYCFRGCTLDKINEAVNKLRKANHTINGGETNSLVAELDRELFNVNLRKLKKQFIQALTPELLNELSNELGIPVKALQAFGVGWSTAKSCWSFPMRDGNGKIIGITYRPRQGKKFNHNDSKPGLFLPDGWKKFKGPVFVPEGVSDAIVLHAMGIQVIGRFNNSQGAELLAEVFQKLPCEVVILGENDSKRNGSWPGRDGAIAVSEKLGNLLGRVIKWALPADGAKDVRSWLSNQGGNDE